MADKMLIDATHPEETRVVVLRGNRVEEFDFESANRKQLRGNIYLAKVTRVEPSLQAAFVEYGGNRHGFLAFSEIHPDYYQIPVADRQALIGEARAARAVPMPTTAAAAAPTVTALRSPPRRAAQHRSPAGARRQRAATGNLRPGPPKFRRRSRRADCRRNNAGTVCRCPRRPRIERRQKSPRNGYEAPEIPASETAIEPAPTPEAGDDVRDRRPSRPRRRRGGAVRLTKRPVPSPRSRRRQ